MIWHLTDFFAAMRAVLESAVECRPNRTLASQWPAASESLVLCESSCQKEYATVDVDPKQLETNNWSIFDVEPLWLFGI